MSFLPYLELKQLLAGWKPDAEWSIPKDANFGLLSTNVAFRLAKELGQAPPAIAETLVADLNAYLKTHKQSDWLAAKTVGPYINVELTPAAYAELASVVDTQLLVTPVKRRVMLEYISTNVAKRLHAGHMRNLNIGDALRRVLELKYGSGLTTDNHWGDWGVQFGALLWGYKREFDPVAYANDPVGELQRVYVWSNAQKVVVENWDDQIRQEFVKLEQGDIENRKLWEEFVAVSKAEQKDELKLLNVKPTDLELGESAYEGIMAELTEFMDRERLWQIDGNARYFDLPELDEQFKNFGRCYLISSNGYTTYAYRDVAARLEWARRYDIETAITVTDKNQSHNFDQAFSIIRYLAELPVFAQTFGEKPTALLQNGELVHLGYGFLSLTTGKMSTREGNVLRLTELVDEAISAARDQIVGRDSKLAAAELERRARVVGVASLKWADLNRDPATDVVLDPAQITAFEGNTGTYQLYAYARLRSVLRKAGMMRVATPKFNELNESERQLLQRLYSFPATVTLVSESFRLNLICEHIGGLTAEVSRWYEANPILKQADDDRRATMLGICDLVCAQLRQGLDLLGIEVLEEL